MSKRLLNAKELAEQTGLKLSRIYQLSRDGKIPHVVIGERQYAYPEERIMRWLGIDEKEGSESTQAEIDDVNR